MIPAFFDWFKKLNLTSKVLVLHCFNVKKHCNKNLIFIRWFLFNTKWLKVGECGKMLNEGN